MADRGGGVSGLAGPSALWYLTRGTGLVALVLLTASVTLGVLGAVGWSRPGWPRFLTVGLHRNISLLVLCLLGIHIGTAVADSYAPITLVQAVIPFSSAYRPVWLGVGALAFDLLLAVLLTTAIRHRMGFRRWRSVHWLAYASWPLAVVHGLGTGTDPRYVWMQATTAACIVAVLLAVWWRIATGLPAGGLRTTAAAGSILVPLAMVAWAATGPLQPGWARKAGTPLALIRGGGVQPAALRPPFSGRIVGQLRQSSPDASGGVLVQVSARVSRPPQSRLLVTLRGQPLPDGSIEIASGTVAFGPRLASQAYTGPVLVAPDGRLVSRVTGTAERLDLRLRLVVNHATGTVHGVLDADAASGSAATPPGADEDTHEASA
jgi:ferric reductase like protein